LTALTTFEGMQISVKAIRTHVVSGTAFFTENDHVIVILQCRSAVRMGCRLPEGIRNIGLPSGVASSATPAIIGR
jgi:hypothetical protein